MTPPASKRDAEELVAWIARSISRDGGTGRRPGRVRDALGWGPTRFAAAVRQGELDGLLDVDRSSGGEFGFVYLVPS